jgi:hypothetical protein
MAMNSIDKGMEILFPMRLLGMKTTFAKQVKPAAAYDYMVGNTVSIWQRSCLAGIVGMKS